MAGKQRRQATQRRQEGRSETPTEYFVRQADLQEDWDKAESYNARFPRSVGPPLWPCPYRVSRPLRTPYRTRATASTEGAAVGRKAGSNQRYRSEICKTGNREARRVRMARAMSIESTTTGKMQYFRAMSSTATPLNFSTTTLLRHDSLHSPDLDLTLRIQSTYRKAYHPTSWLIDVAGCS